MQFLTIFGNPIRFVADDGIQNTLNCDARL